MTEYLRSPVDNNTPAMGVRRISRGRHRGMYQAFQINPDKTIFQGEARSTRQEALDDIDFAMDIQGPARVYV